MSKSNEVRLSVYLGDTTAGEKVYLDFNKYPHLIAVGNTGSGKSEALHRIIEELSKNCSPERAKFILIDPKMIELDLWAGLPHLLTPVNKGVKAGRVAIESAYQLMQERIAGRAGKDAPLFIFIDEVVDLVLGDGKEKTIDEVNAILEGGAAVNIRLIAATQAPWNVFYEGGVNLEAFSYRLIGRMWDKRDSKRYLGNEDATKLEGFRGEMILATPTEQTLVHVQRAEIWEKKIN